MLTDVRRDGDSHSLCSSLGAGYNIHPSPSVTAIYLEAEKCVQFMLRSSDGHLPKCAGILQAISSAVMANLSGKPLFPTLDSHMFDTSVDDNHVHTLETTTAECFVKIRLHHLERCATEMAVGTHVRKQLSKLILFKRQ